jgi:hypothetical protein
MKAVIPEKPKVNITDYYWKIHSEKKEDITEDEEESEDSVEY